MHHLDCYSANIDVGYGVINIVFVCYQVSLSHQLLWMNIDEYQTFLWEEAHLLLCVEDSNSIFLFLRMFPGSLLAQGESTCTCTMQIMKK